MPSTCEWEARICSISVDPERGRPTMKMGSESGAPTLARCAKNYAVQISLCWRVLISEYSRRYRLSFRFNVLPRS